MGILDLTVAAGILRRGGVVAMPTETVYGLAADAFNERAVARVFEAKARPSFDPLIVHVCDEAMAERVAAEAPPLARRLMARFWPGPLTLVLPKRPEVPPLVTSGLETVAVRMPDHSLALSLIRESGCPLAAPSANPFGYVSPTTAEHVRQQLGDKIDGIVDGGACRVGVESTIVGFGRDGGLRLLRPGGVTVEDIEAVAGEKCWTLDVECSMFDVPSASRDDGNIEHPTSNIQHRTIAPGMLPQHYAPRVPVRCVTSGWDGTLPEAWRGKRIGWLGLRRPSHGALFATVECLSEEGDVRLAASRLFAAMRRLDAADLCGIVAELVPDAGLGLAINDRLRRAAGAL
ncbi:MAG: L-threonylcarbamoyladenylate synthase [Kiritimatiellaeota bacterium]|nr:L-threonylcarbamoyladenylate synthase [Kiritimatiellota bacterium]